MSVIINTTKSELEEVIRYARIGANNCMIANSWEVTELVRCKYCEHWKRDENQGDDYFCAFDCNKSYEEDFFCADGERKDGEE